MMLWKITHHYTLVKVLQAMTVDKMMKIVIVPVAVR